MYQKLRQEVEERQGCVMSLSQALGLHALGLVEFTQGHVEQDPQKVLNGWTRVQQANHQWSAVVANGERMDSPFYQTTSELMQNLSNEAKEHIFYSKPVNSDRIAVFCGKLGNRCATSMQEQWNGYVGSVARLKHIAKTRGTKNKSFDIVAADCVRSGQLLGRWLDSCIFE